MLWYVAMYVCTWYLSIIVLLQEEKRKLREAIENSDKTLIQHMIKGNNIDVNADIAPVCMYY